MRGGNFEKWCKQVEKEAKTLGKSTDDMWSPNLRFRTMIAEEVGDEESLYLSPDGQWIHDERTGGVYVLRPWKGGLTQSGRKYPVMLSMNRKMSSAPYGFPPLSKDQAIANLGLEEGTKYYEDWWGQW